MNKINKNALIFEGGGMKGMCYVGGLRYLIKKQLINLNDIKYFGGTSAGSIIACFLASDHNIDEISNIMYNTNWSKFKDGNFGCFRNSFRLISKFGYYNGDRIEPFIDNILSFKFKIKHITFEELFNHTNKHLKIVGTNITLGTFVYFDYINTPKMSVAKAVRISSCIPFVFKPVKYNDEMYIDGGLIKNFDLDMFNEFDDVKSLAFDLYDDNNKFNKFNNVVKYANNIFKMIYNEANKQQYNGNTTIIKIYEPKINPLHFKITLKELKYLHDIGSNCTKLHIENYGF